MLYLHLFWEFFKTGLFAVGGGLATLPFLQDMADRTGWFTRAQLADMLAVSESTPGPIGINMAYSFGLDFPLVIAAVLSGSLFGDHCSPISDTTIMSSMAAGCNHIEHVKTQLPYALVAAGGSFITYLIVGFADMSAAIALPIAIVVALVLYFLCCKLFVKKAA